MKVLKFLILVIIIGNRTDVEAQIAAGFGASYGTDIQQYAPNFRVYYFPNDRICLGPEYAYFPKIKEGKLERELVEYGFSGHYIFNLSESIGFYPLIGINYAIETERELDTHHEKTSLGLNLGAGFHLEYGRYLPFIEYKYVASNLAQSVLSIGLLINLNTENKEE